MNYSLKCILLQATREFDPTILMAIVFPFFFGFCLTDAGYGLVDLIIGVIIFLGLGKNNKLMKGFGLILVACGALDINIRRCY